MAVDAGVQAVVEKAGGKAPLARMLRVSYSAVDQWDAVPRGRVLEIEELLGVPRYVQRPDLFPPPAEEG